MLDEANDLIIERREFYLRPLLLLSGNLLGKIEQRLAWEQIYVIRLASVPIEHLSHVFQVSHEAKHVLAVQILVAFGRTSTIWFFDLV